MLSRFKYLAIVFFILLIWFFPYPPLGDLYNHLATINVIDQIMHGDPYLSEIFEIDLFKPAILPHLIILFLMQFMPIMIAAKFILTIYILLFLFSMEYFFKTFIPKAGVEQQTAVLISLLFTYNILFYVGLLGFFLSVPVFFFLFTYWYKNKENYLFIALSLIVLAFLHLFASFIFLLSIVFFQRKFLKNQKFYLSVLPFVLLFLLWLSNHHLDDYSKWTSFFYSIFSPDTWISAFTKKFFFFSLTSPFGLALLFIITVFFKFSKYSFNLKDPLFQFSLLLLLLFLVLPPDIPYWQLLSSRFLMFTFPFFILGFSKLSKIDSNILAAITIAILILYCLFNAYLFYDFNESIKDFASLVSFIEPNSSIQGIFTPFKIDEPFSGANVYLHFHHYLTLGIPSTYGSDLFDYWYNPIKAKEPMLYDSRYFLIYLNYTFFNPKNCTIYQNYFEDLKTDELYPYYDYIVMYKDECNVTSYFINEYEIIYSNEAVLMKLRD